MVKITLPKQHKKKFGAALSDRELSEKCLIFYEDTQVAAQMLTTMTSGGAILQQTPLDTTSSTSNNIVIEM